MDAEVELLVFAESLEAAAGLAEGFLAAGWRVDCAASESEAQGLFLSRGGHGWLVIAPQVGTGAARSLIARLRSVDADLPVVVFGEDVLRGSTLRLIHRIRSFHPGSRAGIGALQRLVNQ